MKRTICILAPLVLAANALAQLNLTKSRFFSQNAGEDEALERAGFEFENRALPQDTIGFAQQQAAFSAFLSVSKLPGGKKNNWQELGPITPNVAGPWTYTGRPTTDSGRVTALALSPQCHAYD